jgi:hypothetical protein
MARRATKSSTGRSKTAAKGRAKSTKATARKRPSTKATARKRPSTKATARKRPSTKATARKRPSAKAPAKRSRKQSRSGVSDVAQTVVEKTPTPVLAGGAAVAGMAMIAAGKALKPKRRSNSVAEGLAKAGEQIGKLGSEIQHAGDTTQSVGDALSK